MSVVTLSGSEHCACFYLQRPPIQGNFTHSSPIFGTDLVKNTGHAAEGSRQEGGSKSTGTTGEGAAEAPLMLESEDSNTVTGSFDETDDWEREIGLDESIERPPPGARHTFEVIESDGIDLKAPTLLDLLSDEPVEGAIKPIAGPGADREARGSKDSKGKEKLLVAPFEF